MNPLLASIIIALGVAKPKKKKREAIPQSEFDQVTLPKGIDKVPYVETRRERRRFSFDFSLILTTVMMIIIVIVIGVSSLTSHPSSVQTTPDPNDQSEQGSNQIDAMSCIDLKNYYEKNFIASDGENQPPLVYRSWLVYNGTKGWDIHQGGCYSQTGWLNGEEEAQKSDCSGRFFCNETYIFPRDGSNIQFPIGWFYIDSASGKIITDPTEYLTLEGKTQYTGMIEQPTTLVEISTANCPAGKTITAFQNSTWICG